MLMETDGRNSEMYININQSYLLCNSDTVLTELAFDDIHRLEPSRANTLLQLIVRSYFRVGVLLFSHVPKDIIEEALQIKLAPEVFDPSFLRGRSLGGRSEPRMDGLNAIVTAAQQLESTQQTPATPQLEPGGLESQLQLGSLRVPSLASEPPQGGSWCVCSTKKRREDLGSERVGRHLVREGLDYLSSGGWGYRGRWSWG